MKRSMLPGLKSKTSINAVPDLVPNLVNVVKGYAKHEEQVLTEVTQARSNVAGFKSG